MVIELAFDSLDIEVIGKDAGRGFVGQMADHAHIRPRLSAKIVA
jgi:hypothetical protein